MPLPKVLITRPLGTAEPLAEALRQRGYDIVTDPLLEVVKLSFSPPSRPYAAVLITSANAVPPMANAIAKHIRILTVGEATAAAARASGFNAVTCIGQTVEKAAHYLTDDLSLAGASILYLSGTHITHDVTVLMGQAGPSIVRVPVYATRQLALEKTTIQLLSEGGISWIVLFSRRTAEAFSMAVCEMISQEWIKATGLVCLSARTAEPLQGLPWRTVLIAPEPTSAALVESIPHG